MSQFRFADVKVVIADAADLSASSIRNMLFDKGMREFTVVRDQTGMRDALAAGDCDLLVTNSHLSDEDISPLLTEIRQGDLGPNPFVPVISLAWEPSVDNVASLLNGGVDVILTLPLSSDKMDKALEHLLMRRKPFVVTADYIGPDRRKAPRPGTQDAPMTVVPNSFKKKATGKDDADNHAGTVTIIYNQRVESYISRITFTIGKIVGLTGGDNKGTLSGWMRELRDLSTALSYRIAATRYAHQEALCHSLIDITSEMIDRKGGKAQDMDLLQQIALALEIAVKQNDAATVHAAFDIEKMIETTLGAAKSR
ncbi:MAG: hypothetical protein HQL36_08705 [Alphaproteobacteria bacterium]|nr:hypothetical protein [Alphaproteobacteria bacterium]